MQTSSGVTVYIPLVELNDQANELLIVQAENQLFGQSILDEKALDKDWDFVVAPLRPFGLYNQGLHALTALKTFTLKTFTLKIPPWAFYQRIKDRGIKQRACFENQRLSVRNIKDNIEGDSSHLGLAIALLLNASNSPILYAIATGKLSEGAKKSPYRDSDVAIEAVASVPEKLTLLFEKRKLDRLLEKDKPKFLPEIPLFCFTPIYYKKHGQDYPVAELTQVKELAALEIYVKPIKWLSQAAKTLQVDKSRYLVQDKWLAAGAGLITALCLSLSLYWNWWHYPIAIEMLAGKQRSEPFLVCTNRDQSEVNYYDLERDGGTPLLPLFAKENSDYNVGIAWRLRPEKTPFSERYYVAFIHLGEKTGYKLINKPVDSAKELTARAGDVLEWFWPMEEETAQQQNNVLIVALQRTPIAADAMNRAFAARFPATKPLNVLQARDYLLSQFPGSYAFAYKSIVSEPPCIKSSS